MVRHYRPDPIPREVVERIVSTIRRAPSAGYSQGQRLVVVTEPEGRATIARVLNDSRWTAPEGRESWLESAPVHVLVCTREQDYHEDVRVVALVTVGVAAPDPGWSAVASRRTQPRRPLAEAVHWERWAPARAPTRG